MCLHGGGDLDVQIKYISDAILLENYHEARYLANYHEALFLGLGLGLGSSLSGIFGIFLRGPFHVR
jgi:hypothetical protein